MYAYIWEVLQYLFLLAGEGLLLCYLGLAKQGKYTRGLVAGLSEKQCQWQKISIMSKGIPKETNPPLVLKSSKGSPLSSGGGMGDQVHGGALAHFSELPTSMSSYCKRKRRKGKEDTMFFK